MGLCGSYHCIAPSKTLHQDLSKAELLQLNHTQFPSLGIFVSKKVGNQKNQGHFYYISFKSWILGGLSFFEIQLFY